jgi:Icc-related predicted phosphoesterase
MMIIDCVADLHGFVPELLGGDLLIIAGDLTAHDDEDEHEEFKEWLLKQDYKRKILIAGNHDNHIQSGKLPRYDDGIEYLEDSGTEFEGLKIWGSPWTPLFKGVNPACKAFMQFDEKLHDHWDKIPIDTDILITHGPAYGIRDGIPLRYDGTIHHVGSKSLYGHLLYNVRPFLHIFGHIHEGYGIEETLPCWDNKFMQSVNCSLVNEYYKPVNKPVRIIL